MKIKIEGINIGDPKTGNTKGKDWKLYPIGIKTDSIEGHEWINGAAFNAENLAMAKSWFDKKGEEIELEVREEEYNGKKSWKFEFPKPADVINARLEKLEAKVFGKMEQVVEVDGTPTQTDPEPPQQAEDPKDDLPF